MTEGAGPRKRPRLGLLLLIVAAAPLGLGVESALRRLLFPPELDELRVVLEPSLTLVAWIFVGLTAAAFPLGIMAKRSWERRALARLGSAAAAAGRERAAFEALLLGTSVAQLPALLAGVLVLFGAALVPALVAVGVSTLAIAVQGFDRDDGAGQR